MLRAAARSLVDLLTAEGRLRRDHRLYDRRTFALIDRVLPVDGAAVDVGCHEGAVLRRILRRAPRGKHVAFEPLPAYAARLRSEFPGTEIRETALSDVDGFARFVHVLTNPGYSGLRERRYDRPDEKIATLTVRTETLDGALPPERPVAFVKIDVEGAELAVLRGARRTLSRWRPHVVFEHGRGAADRYGAAPQDVFALLDSCGLATSLLERRLAGRPPLSRSEFVRQFETGANWYFVAHPTS